MRVMNRPAPARYGAFTANAYGRRPDTPGLSNVILVERVR
jgi:hypothetical protein